MTLKPNMKDWNWIYNFNNEEEEMKGEEEMKVLIKLAFKEISSTKKRIRNLKKSATKSCNEAMREMWKVEYCLIQLKEIIYNRKIKAPHPRIKELEEEK